MFMYGGQVIVSLDDFEARGKLGNGEHFSLEAYKYKKYI